MSESRASDSCEWNSRSKPGGVSFCFIAMGSVSSRFSFIAMDYVSLRNYLLGTRDGFHHRSTRDGFTMDSDLAMLFSAQDS
ncbi:hypothetical protein ZOSMA_49G00300 [Zostera marina]|uniref:Uncharacterized protein n=1 Tax=Zostera marina TaxID=29655 RepID=A0A0K9NYR1_ZOSMR|nr:hypothetical protein ZOSMA_49G00300 [Zostera marina]